MATAFAYRWLLAGLTVVLSLALLAPVQARDVGALMILQVADSRSEAADRFFLKAVKLYRAGDLAGAVEQFKFGLSIKPENPVAHYFYAETLKAMKREAEALAHYEKAMKFGPDTTEGIMAAAVIPGLRRKVEDANRKREEAAKAEQHAKDDAAGNCFTGSDPTAQILDCSKKIQDFRPSTSKMSGQVLSGIYRKRGGLHHKKRNWALALRDFKKAVELARTATPKSDIAKGQAPDLYAADNWLAWLLATCPDERYRSGAEAVRLGLEAVRIISTPESRDTLAAAYAEAGRFEDAVQEQEAAIANLNDFGKRLYLKNFQARLVLYRQGRPYREP